MKIVVGCLSVIVGCLMALAWDSANALADEKKEEPLKVEARQLLKDYEADPDAADKKYKGKEVEITGVVRTFPYSHPDTQMTLEGGTDIKTKIGCAFGKDLKDALKKLSKDKTVKEGTKVVVKGTCNGFPDPKSPAVKNVRIDNCTLMDPPLPK